MQLKMTKTKYTAIDGRTVVAYTQQDSTKVDPFTITASPSGVSFKGVLDGEFEEQGDIQAFAKLFTDIWFEHKKLMTKIVLTESGH